MKTHNPVGILIFCIIFSLAGIGLIVRQGVGDTPAIVFIYIPTVGDHLHVRCVALYNNHFLFLWFLQLFLNPHRFTSRRIGIYIIPFLGNTEERHRCQQNGQ